MLNFELTGHFNDNTHEVSNIPELLIVSLNTIAFFFFFLNLS